LRLPSNLSPSLVAAGTEKARGATVCGIPLENLSKEELIASIGLIQIENERLVEMHKGAAAFFRALRSPSSSGANVWMQTNG
jgi:hypothetical protein